MGRRWTEDSIRRELETFLPGVESFPSYPVFRAGGRRGLWQAMAKHGGPERFAAEACAMTGRSATPKSRERLRAVLRGSDRSCWPSRRWLGERGGWDLVAALDRSGGPQRWADELGIPLRHPARPSAGRPILIAAAVEPLHYGRTAWPSRLHAAMAARYGLALKRPDLQSPQGPRRAQGVETV